MLRIKNLKVDFTTNGANTSVAAVNGASLHLTRGETLAVIGESGSGKSVMGLSICGLLPSSAKISGRIFFDGKSLLELSSKRLRALRGRKIAFVPQSAGLSLNPTMVSGHQIAEIFTKRRNHSKSKAIELTQKLMARLGLKAGIYRFHAHRLSGGMRQRILIGMGLAGKPNLLIADEPTKGIDHFRRQKVMNLFAHVRNKNSNMAILLITHDIYLAKSIADKVAIMYAGKIMEQTHCKDFFQKPYHPYSQALLNALPQRGLTPIPGNSPHPSEKLNGCAFHSRCRMTIAACKTIMPPETKWADNLVRCWRYAQA